MLIAVSLTPSSIHLLAFLYFPLSAVWVLCFCVLHRGVPAPLRFYMMWIPRHIWLWPCCAAVCEALAVVDLGSCSCACIPCFPFFLPCNLYLPVYSVLLSSGLWVLISIVPWFCISVIIQFTVLLVFGFVLSSFRGALAEVLESYNCIRRPKHDNLYICFACSKM